MSEQPYSAQYASNQQGPSGSSDLTVDDFDIQTPKLSPFQLLGEAKSFLGDEFWLYVGISFVAAMVGGLIPLLLVGPMYVGVYLCLSQRYSGKKTEFDKLFKGFEFFMESLIATLVQVAIAFVFIVPLVICFLVALFVVIGNAASQNTEPNPAIVLSVVGVYVFTQMIVAFLVQIPFLYSYQLIAEHKMKGFAAVKASWTAVRRNFFANMWCVLVFGFAMFLGGLLCYVGALLVLPLVYAAYFLMYKQTFVLKSKV